MKETADAYLVRPSLALTGGECQSVCLYLSVCGCLSVFNMSGDTCLSLSLGVSWPVAFFCCVMLDCEKPRTIVCCARLESYRRGLLVCCFGWLARARLSSVNFHDADVRSGLIHGKLA
eukprot:677643-Rhodomonas_salina.3